VINKIKLGTKKFVFNIKNLENLKRFNKGFKNIQINNVSTINNPHDKTLIFTKTWNNEIESRLKNVKDSLILIKDFSRKINKKIVGNNECIFVNNPRLEYAIILNYILNKQPKKNRQYKELINGVIIGENVNIGERSIIEPFVFINHNSNIGNNCILNSGIRIGSNVSIGDNVKIGQNSVIGAPGFGIEKKADGSLIGIPHLGGVIIGSNVEIGALTTIVSGTIEPTIIEDNIIIDDHVHIAHNNYINKGCMIMACSTLGGSVTIKENSWLGINCSIKNGITIGKNVFIGMGAVVRRSTKDNVTIAGEAAKQFPINMISIGKCNLL